VAPQWGVLAKAARVPRGAARARPPAPLAPRVHGGALRVVGRGAERRLVRQPPAVLRRAVPGLVPPRRGREPRPRAPARRGRGPPRTLPLLGSPRRAQAG